MNKIILIKRYDKSSFFWPNLEKNKNLELTVEQILNKYQGFEGELISFFEIPKNTNHLDFVKIFGENFLKKFFLFFIISDFEENLEYLKAQAIKVGYDIGVCDEDATLYSSIFNEVLFGKVKILVEYKNFLNENLLIPDKSLAEKYVLIHDELSAQGLGIVEDYEPMNIYEIWKLNR